MAPSREKLGSLFHCCLKGRDSEGRLKHSNNNDIYIRKLQVPMDLLEKNAKGIARNNQGKPSIRLERTNRSDEMTALEFEDDEEGFCIGYARILKTPQKERRVKLKPIKMPSDEAEAEDIEVEVEGIGDDGILEEEQHFNSSSIVKPPSGTPVHQKMAMIATVHPFKQLSQQTNDHSHHQHQPNKRNNTTSATESGGGGGSFRIEDVTDDPKYKDCGGGPDEDADFEEGALVEYCRSKVVKPSAVLKQPPLVVRRPSSAVRTPNPATKPPMFGGMRPTMLLGNAKATATAAAATTTKASAIPLQKTTAISALPMGRTAAKAASNGTSLLAAGRIGTAKGAAAMNGGSSSPGDGKLPANGGSRRNTTAGPQPPQIVAHQAQSAVTKLVSGSPGNGGRWRSNSSTGTAAAAATGPRGAAAGKPATVTFGAHPKAGEPQQQQQPMAHVIDVEVGQPCSRMAICNCYGFRPHSWRKVCVHCKCDRSEHEVGPTQALTVYERLGLQKPGADQQMAKVMQQQRKQSSSQQSNNTSASANAHNNSSSNNDAIGSVGHGYAWVPPGISRIKVEEYMAQLPNHMIPRLNSIGEKNREKQLMVQLPRQDLSIAYCKHLKSAQERRLYEEFVNARNEVALDIGFVNVNIAKPMECRKCRGVIERNEMAVMAPKLGEATGWHAACFNCQTCEQLLVDMTYCVRDDKVYCERHFAELHKPRCSACDELIFAGEYTKAMNKDWHSDHFCCWQCDGQLTGQRYILRDDHPYCIKCYEEIFANVCDECQKHIGIDSKDLSYKDKHWHEECFLCTMCKISLVDKPFGSKNDRIYCSNCYDQAFATRCDGCGEIFKAGMKKMEYKGKQWHDKCFVCAHCKSPIGTRSFIPKNEEVFCAGCYEEKFATRCCKCKKVISTGGVTYKNEPWHRECFCCTNCNSSLAGQRFTSKDEKPYCADCYGELFAKRCSACVKPITGIGGAKFISFEDRHWHNDCFLCSQCTTSLVGKGFITDGADILCAECAKARLMAANS